ncbi:MAG: DUF6702 family protein [Flavobacteriales bacterium]
MGAQETGLVNRFTTSRRWMGLLCGVVALVAAAPVHDFHFSRTDVHWNRETQTLQATARVFTDDLELAIRHHSELPEDHPIWLGDDQEWNGADSAITAWLDGSLILHVQNAPVELTWVGKEVELDVSYLYLESRPMVLTGAEPWHAKNTMLFAEFDDQVNEVHLHAFDSLGQEKEKREMLTRDMPGFSWDVNIAPHE